MSIKRFLTRSSIAWQSHLTSYIFTPYSDNTAAMDDPVREIEDIVLRLTQGPPKVQEETINKYFTTNASFTHPFCRTGSFEGSRLLIHGIFRWYKIMSPRIESKVNGIGIAVI